MVKGSIGGRGGLNFIVDTGAVPSVVDSRLSHQLHLAGQPDRVSVFARTVPAERVVLPHVRIGPIQAAGVEVLVEDLSFIEKALGVRIDALIGLDVLGRNNFGIDFARSCLHVGPPAGATDTWTNMTGDDRYAAVESELNGAPVTLMVDTGVNHLILFANRFHGVYANDGMKTAKVSSTIGGVVRLQPAEPSTAVLGHTPLRLTNVFILDTPSNLSLAIDGLLGVAALKPARVEFNFGRRAIGWKW